jgi:general secretion pathway protein C
MLEFPLKKIRLANYMLALLVLVSALLFSRNIISVSFTENDPGLTSTDFSKTAVSRKHPIKHYAVILEKNPFGPPLTFQPLSGPGETPEQFHSLAGLVLVGTITGPEHLSYAVFEDKSQSSSGNQEIFKYGDRVFNYGTLKKILPSSVEIEQGAKTYTVSMPIERPSTAPQKSRAKKTANPTKAAFAKKIGDRKYILNSRIVQESIENPEHILTDARLLPNFKDGKQEGFTISEVVPDGLYDNLGLKNGDVLLKINDLKISNPEVAIQAMSALRGMNRINLDVVRDGKNMSMNYQIR